MRKLKVNIARNHKEARDYDIQQLTDMTPYERQKIARALRMKVYGANCPDVRETGYVVVQRPSLKEV